jgi:hypothetical protein
VFRGIYTNRTNEADKKSHEKHYLLHGAALIGVRSVLGKVFLPLCPEAVV